MTQSDLLTAALDYAARGWHVFPLRPARGEATDAANSKIGKVPLAGLPWRLASTTDTEVITRWWSADDYGIGIDTGKSNLVVIDVDLDLTKGKNGYLALGALGLPATYSVSTPSGGLHLYFTRPADRFIGIDNRGRLGVGIDYRGIGGYVVAPPTRLPVGSYTAGVLGQSVGPLPRSIILRLTEGDDGGPEEHEPVIRPSAVPTGYAASALSGLVNDYENAPAGDGNRAMFSAMCRGLELVNADWCQLELPSLLFELDQARQRRGSQTQREWSASLASAYHTVGSKAATKPPENRTAFDAWMERTTAPAGHGTATAGPAEPEIPALVAEMIRTPEERDNMPDPVWLIRDWLETDSTFSIVGASGSMKSFLAIDLACHVALGRPWHGCPVQKTQVVYVVAEGATGVRKRIAAWEDFYDTTVTGLALMPRAIQARSEEWDELTKACVYLDAGLIILDTQARVTVGLEENSATEMGMFVQRMDELRRATGGAIGAVHHTGRAGMQDGGRGSTALYAAWTAEMGVVKGEDGVVTVESNKEKDGPDDLKLEFKPYTVTLGQDAYGQAITSVVLTRQDTAIVREEIRANRLLDCMTAILEVVASDMYPDGYEFTRTTLQPYVMGEAGYPRRTMHRAVTELLNRGVLLQTGKSGRTEVFVYVRNIYARVELPQPLSIVDEIRASVDEAKRKVEDK